MKSYRCFYAILIAIVMSLAVLFARAETKIESADIPGVATDTRYIEVGRKLEAAAEIGFYNAYVSRGQVNNDEPVVQPEIEITKYGVYFNAWGALDLTDRVTGRRDFEEVDLTAGYKLPLEQVNIRLGIIDYLYPNRTKPETREVFGIFEYPNSILTPRLECYYDFLQARGVYLFAALEHEFAFLEKNKLRLIPGVSSGWGSLTFNDYFYNARKGALNDGNLYAELKYDFTETLTLGVSASYTWLYDNDIRDGARVLYFGAQQWTFAVRLIYKM
jgi:hypothetical protein